MNVPNPCSDLGAQGLRPQFVVRMSSMSVTCCSITGTQYHHPSLVHHQPLLQYHSRIHASRLTASSVISRISLRPSSRLPSSLHTLVLHNHVDGQRPRARAALARVQDGARDDPRPRTSLNIWHASSDSRATRLPTMRSMSATRTSRTCTVVAAVSSAYAGGAGLASALKWWMGADRQPGTDGVPLGPSRGPDKQDIRLLLRGEERLQGGDEEVSVC